MHELTDLGFRLIFQERGVRNSCMHPPSGSAHAVLILIILQCVIVEFHGHGHILGRRIIFSRNGDILSFFFFIRRLGPSIYCSPQNIKNTKHPPPPPQKKKKKIFEILAAQKISLFCTMILNKHPKMHRNAP